MTLQHIHDFAVIGAGIAGASVAWRLAGAGRDTVLLEREDQPAYHTTGRSAAMFEESYGPSAVRALTRASRDFFEQPPAGFCDQALVSPRGVLFVAAADEIDALDHLQEELAASCPGLRRLDQAQALSLAGYLRPERTACALQDPHGADIDVHALHQGFLRGLRHRGGALRTRAEITSARHRDGAWDLQLADGSTLAARTVVNAAGAWADVVGALFGAQTIGLVPCRRSAFTFRAPEGQEQASRHWPMVTGVVDGWYVKPDAGVLLGSSGNADPTVPHDVAPEELDVATGIDMIERASTLTIRRPLRTWAGLRSFVPDGEMVIGWDAHCPGFFWLAGQGGYGIQSSPGASALAAQLLLGLPMDQELERCGVEPADLSPRRLLRG